MSDILIVAEQHGGHLRKATLNALGAGQELARRTGGKLHVLVLGQGVAALAEELKPYGEVHVADAPVLQHYLAEAYAPVVADLARAVKAAYVGAAATAFGKDLLPRAAARLGAATATEVLSFGGEGAQVTFRRPMWAGNVLAEVELATPIKAFTVRATEFAPAAKGSGGGVAAAAVNVDPASRAAVDAGWVPNDWQVGQTGKVVAPELYIAAGISGAIQHLAGMKGSKVIVAVNKDPEAPIFQIADYGLVADLFKALPELRAKIKAAK
jgi:electron transfer flavoprotein alpha subunit